MAQRSYAQGDSPRRATYHEFAGEHSPRAGLSQKLRDATGRLERLGEADTHDHKAPYVSSTDSTWDAPLDRSLLQGSRSPRERASVDVTWDMALDRSVRASGSPRHGGSPSRHAPPPSDPYWGSHLQEQSDAVGASMQGARAALANARAAQYASPAEARELERSMREGSPDIRRAPPPPPPPRMSYSDLDRSVRDLDHTGRSGSKHYPAPALDYADLDRSVRNMDRSQHAVMDCADQGRGDRGATMMDYTDRDLDRSMRIPAGASVDAAALAKELALEREKRQELEKRVDEAEYIAIWLKQELDRSVQETREVDSLSKSLRQELCMAEKHEAGLREEIAELQTRMAPVEVEQMTRKMTEQLVAVEEELQVRIKELANLGGPFLQGMHELLRPARLSCARMDSAAGKLREVPPLFDPASGDLQANLRGILDLMRYIVEVLTGSPKEGIRRESREAASAAATLRGSASTGVIPRQDSPKRRSVVFHDECASSPSGSPKLAFPPRHRSQEDERGRFKEYTASKEVTRLGFQFFPFDKQDIPRGTVEKVLPESWAEAVGISTGDQVFQVNGSPVNDMDEQVFLAYLTQRPVTLLAK